MAKKALGSKVKKSTSKKGTVKKRASARGTVPRLAARSSKSAARAAA